jgi:arylsulfatase A-like enzyme
MEISFLQKVRKGHFLKVIFIPLTGIALLMQYSCNVEPAPSPNILFIFADDQSYNTVAALGNDEVRTPNIDRLAAQGLTFTHAYNMGGWSGALCVASRTMINTGRFIWRAEQLDKNLDREAANGRMWSQLMKQAGYETYFTGKWHIRINPETLFDHVRHVRPGMPRTVPEAYDRPYEGQEDDWSPFDTSNGGFWEGGRHWSEVLGDDAVDFIGQASQNEKPFFMYLAFNAPHDPRQSPREYVEMYPAEHLHLPESFQPMYPYAEQIGCGPELRDARLAPFPRTEYAVRVHRQEYYAIISHMDTQIGRILNALEKSGMEDNTYIFFTADHGLAVGHHGLIGKQNMYDHSIRPPMIVVGPDVPRNRKLEMDVYLQDIMPTAIELAGIEVPWYVEFKSMLPSLKGERTESAYGEIYGCYKDLQRMIRAGGHKLIVYPYVPKVRLYDLEKDPFEMNDLADDPANEALVRDLFARLEKLGRAMDDTLDLRSFFPDL